MKKLNISVIALAISLAFSAGAMAEGMSRNEYKADKEKIAAEYKSAKSGCVSLSGNANDICIAEAKGKEKVAKAELEANYKPTVKNRYQVRVAKAEADYAVANERCDDLAGNAKDVCVKEAKAAKITAMSDAKTQKKTVDANVKADKKSTAAHSEAKTESADARKDATANKIDAEYAVAKEKCDTFAGTAKDSCLNQAKKDFGK